MVKDLAVPHETNHYGGGGEAMSRSGGRAPAKPVLKWAGGKRQLLPELLSRIPARYGRYIEPMVGGGALFFALAPGRAILADTNPELINLYRVIVADLDGLVARAASWPVNEDRFYALRALWFDDLDPVTAAARTLYLNRTCYNGLYRVNRRGEFNVPWGRYRDPVVVNPDNLQAARRLLGGAQILLGDYVETLAGHARKGDLVFLDPPYVPVSEYSDFKRYTKEQFRQADHVRMREVVGTLRDRGCTTILANSNHPLIAGLYEEFGIEVIETRRNINSVGSRRSGQDVIVTIPPAAGA